MGNTCQHCLTGVEDCLAYFAEGCTACFVCLRPCCTSTSQRIKLCCAACSCAQLALCLECTHNPCIILDQSTPEIVEVLSSYAHKTHFIDEWYGDVILLEHKDSHQLAVLKIVDYFYENEYQEQFAQFSQRKRLKHDNVVQLRDFVSRQEEGFCTSIYKSFLIFDYILTDFATEFEKRIETRCFYSEADFYPIFYQIIAGMAFLNSNGIYHGSLRMRNIFITPEFFKVADPHLFETQNDYSRLYSDKLRYSQFVFLSPELLSEFDKGVKEPQVDWFKSDVYSLGMVFLQICSRVQSSQCYDYEQNVIFEDKINSHLQSIKLNYHDFFYFTIKNMLTVKVSQRPTFQQLLEQLEKNPKCKQPIQRAQLPLLQSGGEASLQQSQIIEQPLIEEPQGIDMFGYGLLGLGTETPQKKELIENVKERYPDGSKYVGSMRNGLRHGKGKFIHSDGSYYEGQWKDNKMSGKGVLYNSSGKVVYDGNWANDQYSGMGTEYNQDMVPSMLVVDYKNLQQPCWVKYEGNFKNDLRDGFGTLSLQNGDKYIGGFKNGVVNGHGTYQAKGAQPIQGKWVQGIYQK